MAESSHVRDVIQGYGQLNISDDDQEGLILEELPTENQYVGYEQCLIGSLLTNKKVNSELCMRRYRQYEGQ